MQVNATIIAAQQAAREARAVLLAPKQPQPAASFLTELKGAERDASAPAAKPAAASAAPAAQTPAQTLMRPGSLLDIKI